MSIDKTSGINHNLVGRIAGNKNLARPEDTKKAAKASSVTSGEAHTSGVGDKIEISVEARELHKQLSTLKAEVNKMPDTRDEKIKDVRARIQGGHYDQDAVTKEVARSIKESGLI